MQDLLYISDELMPALRSYKVDLQDIDSADSGRSETGVMFRNRVRAGVYRIQATWRVRREQLNRIISAISPAAVEVRFFDPNTDSVQVRTMFAGDRSSAMLLNSEVAGETWWDFSVEFVEY